MVIIDFIVFGITLAVLIKASDIFVDAAERIANILNISSYIIGFTLVAIGTSLPELVSSIGASFYNSPGIILGNIIGSNIANIGLILGLAAIIAPISNIKKRVFNREGIFLIIISIAIFLLALNSHIGRIEGIILILIFIAYTFYITQFNIFKSLYATIPFLRDFIEVKILHKAKKEKIKEEIIKQKKPILAILKELAMIIVSGAVMIFSVEFLIPAVQNLALGLGLSETIVGITMLAVGTSLPELMVAISSARKGLGDLLIGTIIGSNISNILLVGGLSSIILPLTITKTILYYYFPFMVALTIALLFFIRANWQLRKTEGLILLTLYIGFIISVFII